MTCADTYDPSHHEPGDKRQVSKVSRMLPSDIKERPQPRHDSPLRATIIERRSRLKRTRPQVDEDKDTRRKNYARPRTCLHDKSLTGGFVVNAFDNLQRRRTWLREAQRAYRRREEATISTLSKKVEDLNEQMSSIFTSLCDSAINSGLLKREPEFGRQLQEMVTRCLVLIKLPADNRDGSYGDIGNGL